MKMKYLITCGLSFILLGSVPMCSAKNATSVSLVKDLWPKGTKNIKKGTKEKVWADRGDNVRRITDIMNPTLTVFPATNNKKPSPAVLVFPGGGYSYLVVNKEGTEIADWLNSIGITAILVKYRVPDDRKAAFQDGQRAMRLVRYNAKKWNINPKKIGVIGFSAGGHLAARLSTAYDEKTYKHVDGADKLTCKPDFCILVYPAYLTEEKSQKLSDELHVTAKTPPTYLVHTEDDHLYVNCSKVYYRALKKAGVVSEFKLFKDGGHGFGLRKSKHSASKWPQYCEKWLKKNGIIK